MSIQHVIISGGGTGGHIYPAISIANAMKEIDPAIEFLFVGAEGKMEMEKVPKAGFKIIGLPIVGIQRTQVWKNLFFPFKLIKSLWQSVRIIQHFKPDVAVGVGGYASGPLLLAARFLGIPYYIQEQNSFAGITNKALAAKAEHIFVAYPGMEKFFPAEKITLSGNPVRKDLIDAAGKKELAAAHFQLDPAKKTILIIGGSQGARSINQSILAGLDQLVKAGIQVIWQTGVAFESTAKQAASFHPNTYVSAFIYEMDLAYAMADLVISRAGASSVSEICLIGKASILVPLPSAAEDHQTENAKSLVSQNAAILVRDVEVKEKLVSAALAALKTDLSTLEKNSLQLAKPNAAHEIALSILQA
ncbi:undecaprenyldiphospho-muramoylpentapeptide beta-N-acetylglucosaminyltransferase [Aquirufa sp. HETE-83D]|uniref:UDP-N-acetylglucosamine--N-acetylmuramyl-(pentapeptide) pyrophosphoryl-undecaprenol N-acetylglucosamine transferase n=1 Tax=Aquirufa esocilacus TaxID=3096513 RepID=A0ABW6DK02_9BACT